MDFDALVNVKRIIKSGSVANTDIMLLSSAINNKNVDINLSIQGNLDIFREQEVDNNEFMMYLGEFIGLNQELLNPPIYKLLIKNKAYWSTILNALKNGLLTDETFSEIVRYLFTLLPNADHEYEESLLFLHDVLSVKKVSFVKSSNIDQDMIDFIIDNLDSLEYSSQEYNNKLAIKSIIIKMFTLGIVKFSDLLSVDTNDGMLIDIIVKSFVRLDEYYNLYAVLNENSVDRKSASIIMVILENMNQSNEFILKCMERLTSIFENVPRELK